jgi:AAA+ ATPase superfamily predicted ATPase
VERIYNEAMLQGRADYLLIDDFDFETTKDFLERYGFKEEEINTVWMHFGGKPVYLIKALENRENLNEFCETMVEIRYGQILDSLYELKRERRELFKSVLNLLETIEESGKKYVELDDAIRWCVDRNILFVNPIKRVVKPQSKLDFLAIRRALGDIDGVPR